jgi:hypothetical protein
MKVGQKLYLEPIGIGAVRYTGIKETIVTKIGRKFFETEGYGKFELTTLRQYNGQYPSQYQAYGSLLDIENREEAKTLQKEIMPYFGTFKPTLTLEQLKKIMEVINGDS